MEEIKWNSIDIIKIDQLLNKGNEGSEYIVAGWVRTIRHSKAGFSFVSLNDGTCFSGIQVVIDEGIPSPVKREEIATGSSVVIKGLLKESPGKGQKYEISAVQIMFYRPSDPEEYPIQKKETTLEYLRTISHLRLRTNTFGAVFRIRNTLSFAVHRFFQERGFMYVHTPIITSSDCEGAGELFSVTSLDLNNIPKSDNKVDFAKDFFKKPGFLTVSGQLEAESFACAFGNVYTFGPTFRAENSNTARHLSEFWMIEPEMAFCDLEKDIVIAESFLKYIIKEVLDKNHSDLEFMQKRYEKQLIDKLESIVNNDFVKISYKEAMEILAKSGKKFEYKAEYGLDIHTEHERFLSENHFKKPVVVMDYPTDIKAFYMKQNDDNKTVAAMDVLFPRIGEIIGGSQREDDPDKLKTRLINKELNPEEYWWYMDLRKYGSVPHSGFGLGFERMVMYCTGMANIRDVIPFARTPGNLEF